MQDENKRAQEQQEQVRAEIWDGPWTQADIAVNRTLPRHGKRRCERGPSKAPEIKRVTSGSKKNTRKPRFVPHPAAAPPCCIN